MVWIGTSKKSARKGRFGQAFATFLSTSEATENSLRRVGLWILPVALRGSASTKLI